MYILSQNEQILYNWDNISSISITEIDSEYLITVSVNNNANWHEIGNYATYKDAKTVLEEIQEFISTKCNYIMPKREEMKELWKMENTSQEQSQQL